MRIMGPNSTEFLGTKYAGEDNLKVFFASFSIVFKDRWWKSHQDELTSLLLES